MLNEELIEKLAAWVDANPEAADTPYMNVSSGVGLTVRSMLNMARASLAGEVQLDPNLQSELDNIESWIGEL